MKAPELTYVILGVILIGIFFYKHLYVEGFNTMPSAAQTSSIPEATPGATSSDPTKAKPSPLDVQANLDQLKLVKTMIDQKNPETTNLSQKNKDRARYIRDNYTMLQSDLISALANPDTAKMTLAEAQTFRSELAELLNEYRSVTANSGMPSATSTQMPQAAQDIGYAKLINSEPMPTVTALPPGKLTLTDLQTVKMRVDDEKLRLANLRSSSSSITARISQLEKLSADLGDIITSVERKVTSIDDVQISKDSAEAFLKELTGNTGPIPPLITPGGSTPAVIATNPITSQFGGVPMESEAIQKLLSAARDLKWSMEVRLEYDPALRHKERMMMRLERVMKYLTKANISQAQVKPKEYDECMKEIRLIQHHLASQQTKGPGAGPGPEGGMSRMDIAYGREPTAAPMPAAAEVYAAQGAGCGPQNKFPDGEISSDVYIRPGFPMNDEQIARRGSASAFDDSTVPGADYKKRALDLCRQIKSAQLGDPASFGCIENPDAVGPNYSWKGNHTMVCNRLGDSWGRSYPEQFGCPPYDPAAKFSYGL